MAKSSYINKYKTKFAKNAGVNLLPKSVQMRAKDRLAIPANLYRIKQIDCP